MSRRIPADGAGPGHSFVLTPDGKRGFVNSAGSDLLAVVDPVAGEVIERVEMDAFPLDVDLSPDGSFGYVPHRDGDAVAMLYTKTLEETRRVEFPEGSRPWMLRASPDGKEVWVRTASGTNVVLDSRMPETLHTEKLDEQTAWSPDGRYYLVTHFADDWVAVMDPRSGRLVKRIEVGQNGANVSSRPDGGYGYVTVTGEDAVAVVEMDSPEVETRFDVGKAPMGLIVL